MISLKEILLIISEIKYNTFRSDPFLSGMWLINFDLTFLLSLKPFRIYSKNPNQFFSKYQRRSGFSLTDGEVYRNDKLLIIGYKGTTDINPVLFSRKEPADKHFTLIKIRSQYYVINEYCPRRRVRYCYSNKLKKRNTVCLIAALHCRATKIRGKKMIKFWYVGTEVKNCFFYYSLGNSRDRGVILYFHINLNLFDKWT